VNVDEHVVPRDEVFVVREFFPEIFVDAGEFRQVSGEVVPVPGIRLAKDPVYRADDGFEFVEFRFLESDESLGVEVLEIFWVEPFDMIRCLELFIDSLLRIGIVWIVCERDGHVR